jgi:pimeloyl-ACP methyl ester carboxylesterase
VRGELVRVFTEDGLELHGLFCQPEIAEEDKTVVLHIHGFTGNFYQERFVGYISDALTEAGCALLTVNTRGRDYLSYFSRKTDTGSALVQIGGAYELLEECIYDIKAWINFLEARGYFTVILEGESLGTLKVVLYQHQTQDRRVQALVLISPLDHIGLQRTALADRYEEAIRMAKHMIEQGKPNTLMPKIYCPLWAFQISAKTYLSAFDPEAKNGIFNFHDPNARFEVLSTIKDPILATYGTVREAVVDNKVEEALSTLKKRAVSAKRCNTALIQGAPHNYLDHEKELAERIKTWLVSTQIIN